MTLTDFYQAAGGPRRAIPKAQPVANGVTISRQQRVAFDNNSQNIFVGGRWVKNPAAPKLIFDAPPGSGLKNVFM